MAEPDVKLPGLGKVNRKTLLIGGAVAAAILGYLYIRRSRGGGSSSSGTGSTDSSGTDTSSQNIDPVTGYPYGSAEDQQALAAQQDTGTAVGDNIDPATGYAYGSAADQQALGLGTTSTSTSTAVTTNAEWEQECIGNLEAGGVSQATISAAESGLPRYLAHLTLSDAQATAVQLALGLTGPPPSGGPYSIRRAPDHHKPPAAEVTVPSVTGIDYEQAATVLHSVGLVAHRGQKDVGRVTEQSPAAGIKVKKGSAVTLHGTGNRPIT